MSVTGVYFDTYKQRWMAKLQIANKIIRKGFKDFNDAVKYRKELENMNIIVTDSVKISENNRVRQEEHKIIEYKGHTQEFIERNTSTGEVNTSKFYVPASRGKVMHKDIATIVILEDGSKGVAKCNKEDNYSRKTGLKIAYNRAMIQHLLSEIEKLSK